MDDAAPRLAVVDVETSGWRAARHRIVQLAVVTSRADGTVLDRWSTLVAPLGRRVGPTEVHGLARHHLRGAPSFARVAPELLRRLDGAVFVAHHAAFDWAFVTTELYRCGYRVPRAEVLCTLRLSRASDPERQLSHRLPDVCERWGVPLAGHHDALADAEATAALVPHLLGASPAPLPAPVSWAHAAPSWPRCGAPVRWARARFGRVRAAATVTPALPPAPIKRNEPSAPSGR